LICCRNQNRLHNLTLSVGPGTPASILYAENLRNHSRDRSEEEDDSSEEEDEVTWTRVGQDDETEGEEAEEESEEDHSGGHRETGLQEETNEGDDGEDGEDEDDDADLFRLAAMRMLESYMGQQQHDSDGGEQQIQQQRQRRKFEQQWKPDLRHGGCINTACWLDVPWRLSLAGMASSIDSNDDSSSLQPPLTVVDDENHNPCNGYAHDYCPTQLATSGDDRVVKLWDARYAMGTANPLIGGWDTFCPLASKQRPVAFQSAWKKHYRQLDEDSIAIAGSVLPLATLTTGHRGNVFHITPLAHSPGKLLTCAADGYLRQLDITAESSSVVIHPLANASSEDLGGFLAMGLGLAFSHVMLSANTGLLCSERGLHLFDLRLSPREQQQQSLLAAPDSTARDGSSVSSDSMSLSESCKACAVWRPSAMETESHYVFAGGAGACVDLYDLRVDGSGRQVVERYRPRNIDHPENMSVSGLDVSKDGKELLVSYESDQIYSFPIIGNSNDEEAEGYSNHALPSLEEVDAWAKKSGNRMPTTEAMGYGGHLNRFTFLKNARYAGPHDEYICTGSDSGHAWIMERNSGTVVSLMSADSSTCNGVIPHPSLPFFISYGIDSTARIWRATTPVDPSVDDSPSGRALCAKEEKYEMSPLTQSPKGVQMLCARYTDGAGVMPDFIATRQEISACGKFSAPNRRGMVDYDSPRIGNSLRSLPSLLRSNRYECYRTAHQGMGTPIESELECFTIRASLSRLLLQARRFGVAFSLHQPWNFRNIRHDIHPSDVVPDNPSDWILLDKQMTPWPISVDYYHMNWSEWKDFLIQRDRCMADYEQEQESEDPPVWLQASYKEEHNAENDFSWPVQKSLESERNEECKYFCGNEKTRSQRYLYETALLLKEGGNIATKDGQLNAAARRYDKAIQYCSVAFLKFNDGEDKLFHLRDGLCISTRGGSRGSESTVVVWSPLLRVLITSRLNMALLLLKPRFAAISDAITQIMEALRLLGPFTARKGAVVVFTKRWDDASEDEDNTEESNFVFEEEPEETYKQARALQAKSYFRLGSANMEKGDFDAACQAYQASIQSSDRPDNLVARRLQEAKSKRSSKKKRDRRKFEVALGENADSN